MRLWTDSFEKRRRRLAWAACGRIHWPVLLPDAAANRKSMVRGRLSCGLGLGRKFFLFGARQRHGLSRTSAEFVVAWTALAQWRLGRTRREFDMLRRDWLDLDCV